MTHGDLEQQHMLAPSLRRFFSLKWQALLFTSFVLITVMMVISLRGYINLNAQFEKYRDDADRRHMIYVETLTDQSLGLVRKLASILPSLPGMQASLASGDGNQIEVAFQSQWPVIQTDWGFDIVSFYDRSNSLLAEWTQAWEMPSENNPQQQRRILQWVEEVNFTEQPKLAIDCNGSCMQYATVPMLAANEGTVGALLVGTRLDQMVLEFSELAGSETDIALLIKDLKGKNVVSPERVLPNWDAHVVSVTGDTQLQRNINLQAVREAADIASVSKAIDGVLVWVRGHSYEITLLPVPKLVDTESAYFVVIADVTEALVEIREGTQEIIIGGIGGWLLSELLLLGVLWRPLSRLRETTGNLPLLAKRQFQSVRNVIGRQVRSPFVDDETDILNHTTIALADRLEALEGQVTNHTQALAKRMDDLERERDFNVNLLDTAQVMIVTQDRAGQIVMANAYTEALTGYRETEMVGRDFVATLLPDEVSVDLTRRLREGLHTSDYEHLRHESMVTCRSGAIRNVTWYHSRLQGRAENDPIVLSVGLDITERLGAESQLAWLADHDTLTGLWNRRRFHEELDLVLAGTRRHKTAGALFFIDLDHFSYFNDTRGSHSGDALLRTVGKLLTDDVEAADAVARLSGDEFAVLVRETDAQNAIQIATTVQTALNNLDLSFGGQSLRVSASIGIVLFPTQADNVNDLLASADIALIQAKEKGFGHWHLFAEGSKTRERLRKRIYWRGEVARALVDDRFVLYFQPIMDIKSSRISHYEVLLRMRDDHGNIILPAQFIDTVERIGMIHEVDRLVVKKAIACLANLRDGGQDVTLAVNLSGRAFNDAQLLSHVRHELKQSQVDSSKLIFEITETAAVSDFAEAKSLMLAIKELGCQFALDDFGIGFSSFYYLKQLPVDYLKIDGSFIRHLADSFDDQIIVQAMSQVATGFGKKTVAEFVETEVSLSLLRQYDIDYAQGFLIGKPQSAEDTFHLNNVTHVLSQRL